MCTCNTSSLCAYSLVVSRKCQFVRVQLHVCYLLCIFYLMVISTLGPNVTVQADETRIPAGGQAAILCTIDSPLGIVSLNWTINDTEIDLSWGKYEGMILGTHTLKIIDFQSDDSGRYRCIAATALGTSQSEEIEIKTIGKYIKWNTYRTKDLLNRHSRLYNIYIWCI